MRMAGTAVSRTAGAVGRATAGALSRIGSGVASAATRVVGGAGAVAAHAVSAARSVASSAASAAHRVADASGGLIRRAGDVVKSRVFRGMAKDFALSGTVGGLIQTGAELVPNGEINGESATNIGLAFLGNGFGGAIGGRVTARSGKPIIGTSVAGFTGGATSEALQQSVTGEEISGGWILTMGAASTLGSLTWLGAKRLPKLIEPDRTEPWGMHVVPAGTTISTGAVWLEGTH
jgi:hypothetical protein